MNPSDLLNTNRFMAKQRHNKAELERDTYNNVPNRVVPNKVQQFIRDGAYQGTMINKAKQQIQQWPPTTSKVTQPVLSREVSDLVENRYSKYRNSYVSIDNRDGRNPCDPLSEAVTVNNYQVYLNKKFENVVSIELVNIMISKPTGFTDTYFYMSLDFPKLKNGNDHSLIKTGTLFNNSHNLFSKIIFRPNTSDTSEFVQNIDQFYNEPIDKLDCITIDFVDREGNSLAYNTDSTHTFTLKIVEKIDLLKETMYDTRRGRPVTVGMGQLGGVGHV